MARQKSTRRCSECPAVHYGHGLCRRHWRMRIANPREAEHRSSWMLENRSRYRDQRTCDMCSAGFETHPDSAATACTACRALTRRKFKRPPKTAAETEQIRRDRLSNLRRAYEDGAWSDFLTELRRRCVQTQNGCWEWSGKSSRASAKTKSPYATVSWSGRSRMVHRLSLEAKYGLPLGSQQAHHVCANTICVNPEHLEPATHAENVGEMKARISYEARILELELALADCAPGHPALIRVSYGRSTLV